MIFEIGKECRNIVLLSDINVVGSDSESYCGICRGGACSSRKIKFDIANLM